MRTIFKAFLASSVFLSASAFAVSDAKLARICMPVGKAKIAQEAEHFGVEIDLNRVEVAGIDNRWYNPSKYIWYRVASAQFGDGQILKLVQYSRGRCF